MDTFYPGKIRSAVSKIILGSNILMGRISEKGKLTYPTGHIRAEYIAIATHNAVIYLPDIPVINMCNDKKRGYVT
jgi:hypothetical protein